MDKEIVLETKQEKMCSKIYVRSKSVIGPEENFYVNHSDSTGSMSVMTRAAPVTNAIHPSEYIRQSHIKLFLIPFENRRTSPNQALQP